MSSPYPPPQAGIGRAPQTNRQRPHEVRVAAYLWVASLVLSVVGVAVSFGSIGPMMRKELSAQAAGNPELAAMDPDLFVTIASYAVVAATVLGLAVRVFFLVKFAAGRRWARTGLAVLGALSIAGAVLSVRSGSAVDAALSVVQALVIAAAIVYMFSEGAKPYFALAPRR